MTLDIGIFGVAGRMGRAVASCALRDPAFRIRSAIVRPNSPLCGQDLGTLLGLSPLGILLTDRPSDPLPDLFIDFSLAPGLSERLAYSSHRPLVIGTTALSPSDFSLLREASSSSPIFYASNFSIGMALLHRFVGAASRAFPFAHIDLIETHHAEKKDAPSGSALSLAASIRKSTPHGSISIHSLRSGQIVGEHSLQFNTAEERIELFHQVHTRDAFAKGALTAAQFLATQPPGLYGMDELLAIKDAPATS